ncbi:hypothetical protein CLOM_g5267 [Closterium sp. NIES-68]|nr:hypothetical protein CLOM_g5267 [Closterium sp. NIES-68]
MARRSSVVALLVLSLAACATAFDLSEPGGVELSRVIRLSDKDPRAFLYKSFLSDEECDHIVAIAAARLARSAVTDSKSGQSVVSEVRTSSGMFLSKGEDDVIRAMEQRVSEWTFLPVANQEALQVLRYGKGQKYDPHFDYFSDPVNTQLGGHRYATVLMYLNNVTKGGETVFPTHKDDTPKDDSWSDCAKGLLAVKPSKGDALLFFNMQPDGARTRPLCTTRARWWRASSGPRQVDPHGRRQRARSALPSPLLPGQQCVL